MVDCGQFSLDRQGLIAFADSVTWLILDYWQHIKKKEVEQYNLSSISIAKQSIMIESAFSSFGNGEFTPNLEQYLPFSTSEDNKIKLEQQTIDVYWDFMADNRDTLPEHIFQAFNEPELMAELKRGR